ncbi:MAG: hypothetical protein CNE98_07020 [Bacteroidetes bacterium MED-G17]|nr:MAG: hypothetical protein CNE98_07020 [Bacteroidetes bacterium MED-G17]
MNEVKQTISDEAYSMKLLPSSLRYLESTHKWVGFFSVLGFIMIGLLLVGSLFASSLIARLDQDSQSLLPIENVKFVYLGICLVYFFPIWYLYKFSRHTKKAIAEKNNFDLDQAFRYNKKYWKFLGILTIIVLIFYAIIICKTIAEIYA